MEIGVFIDLFRPFVLGGAEKNCFEVCKRLVGENEIKVFTCRLKGEKKRGEIEGIKIYRVGLPHSLERREVILILPYLFISILYGLKEEFEILYGNGFAGALAAGIVSLLKRKPLVLMLHDVYWDRWGEVIGFSLPGKLLEKLISKLPFFKVITVSDKVRKKLTGILRIPKNKIEVIPDGIDLKLIDSIKTKRKDNLILCVSRLVNYKNVDHVIKAFAKAKKVSPNLELKIIGSGPERDKLEKLVKELKVKDIEFLGYLPSYNQVIKYMKEASLLVHCSAIEGFGIVLLEAMASRLPIVAYELEVYHQFANEKNSVLIKGNVNELSKKILKLIEDKSLCNKLIKNGYKTAKEYDWEIISKRILKVLESSRIK